MVYVTVTKNSPNNVIVENPMGQSGNLHTETAKLVAQGYTLVQAAGGGDSVVLVFHKDGD